MRFGLTLVSRNRKTGPIPVATSSSDTCPSTCALLTKGCYAKTGPIKLAWDRVEKNGMDFKAFLAAVRKLPRRQLWRYGQAGDLPASPDDIKALAQANAGRPVLAYTHRRDFDAIKDGTFANGDKVPDSPSKAGSNGTTKKKKATRKRKANGRASGSKSTEKLQNGGNKSTATAEAAGLKDQRSLTLDDNLGLFVSR